MIIGELKCIFIDITKTAGTSVGSVFREYGGKYKHNYFYNSSVNKYFDSLHNERLIYTNDEKYKDYYKFTIVRNPYSRLLSYFFWFREISKTSKDHYLFKYLYSEDYNIFVENLYKYWYIFKKHMDFKPMIDWIRDDNYNILVDRIYYFEDLNNEWKILSDKLNINDTLPHLYNTNSSKRNIFVSEKTKYIINELYNKDFKIFKYKKVEIKQKYNMNQEINNNLLNYITANYSVFFTEKRQIASHYTNNGYGNTLLSKYKVGDIIKLNKDKLNVEFNIVNKIVKGDKVVLYFSNKLDEELLENRRNWVIT